MGGGEKEGEGGGERKGWGESKGKGGGRSQAPGAREKGFISNKKYLCNVVHI